MKKTTYQALKLLDTELGIKNNKPDFFPFQIVGMPFFNSSLPSKIFYSFIVSEILCLGRNSRSHIRDDIDMKLGPVTKLDKRNKVTSKFKVSSIILTSFRQEVPPHAKKSTLVRV